MIKNEYKLHFWKETAQAAYLSDHMSAGSAGHTLYQEAKANDVGVRTMNDVVELFKNEKGKKSQNYVNENLSQSLSPNRYCIFRLLPHYFWHG